MLGAPTLLGGSACSSAPVGLPPIDFDTAVIWESEHFEYHLQEGDDSVCEGVMENLEKHFDVIQDFLGFPWPQGRKIKYYKLLEGQIPSDFGCPERSQACYRGNGEIVSSDGFHKHELVHAYTGPIDFDSETPSASYLSEGLAESLSDGDLFARVRPAPWREVFDDGYENLSLLSQAAWFVGYLLRNYPASQFMEWYQKVAYRDASATMADKFERAYGRNVDDVWAESVAAGNESLRRPLPYECSGPEIGLGETVSLAGSGCDGESFTTIHLDGESTVVLEGVSGIVPDLYSCDSNYVLTWRSPQLVALAPEGKYLVGGLYQDNYNGVSVAYQEVTDHGFSRDCDSAIPVSLESRGLDVSTRTSFSVPGGEWYLALEAVGSRAVSVGVRDNLTVQHCDSCGGMCETLEGFDRASFDETGRLLLKLEGGTEEASQAGELRLELLEQ